MQLKTKKAVAWRQEGLIQYSIETTLDLGAGGEESFVYELI